MSVNSIRVLIPSNKVVYRQDCMETDLSGVYKQLKYVEEGISFTEEFDGNLDSCMLKYLSNTGVPINQYTPVKIEVISEHPITTATTEENYDFIVATDVPTKISSISSKWKYEHILTLIEPTSYLEKIVVPAHGCTRKYTNYGQKATLYDQVEDELKQAMGPVNVEATTQNRFTLSYSLSNTLRQHDAEDFFFSSPMTLREILDQMFALINARCCVKSIETYDQIQISSKSFRIYESNKSIPTEWNGDKKTPIYDSLSKQLEIYATNATSSNKQSVSTGWTTFRATDSNATLTTDNIGFVTEHPIEKIVSFKVQLRMKYVPSKVANVLIEATKNWLTKAADAIISGATKVRNFFAGLFGDSPQSATTVEEVFNLGSNDDTGLTTDLPELDISDYIVDMETYNKLSTDEQKMRIPYERGSSSASVGTYTTILYIPVVNFSNIISHALNEQIVGQSNLPNSIQSAITIIADFTTGINEWLDNIRNSAAGLVRSAVNLLGADVKGGTESLFDMSEAIYNCEYIPYVDVRAQFSKDNIDNAIPFTCQLDNQSDKSIDVIRYGDIEKKKINATGNLEYDYSTCHFGIGQLLANGTMFNDRVTCVTAREYAISPSHVEVAYKFTENYGSVHGRLSINREHRLYQIPLASNQIDRHILIKRYITLSNNIYTNDIKVLNNSTIYALVAGFVPGIVGGQYPKYAIINTYSDDIGQYADTIPGNYQLLVARYSMATSMMYTFKFHDNYDTGVGNGSRVIGGIGVLMNRYVNKNTGRYDRLRIKLAKDRRCDTTGLANIKAIYDKLPLIDSSHLTYDYINDYTTFSYTKDAYDHDIITMQYEFVTDCNHIFIGNKISELNALMHGGYVYFKASKSEIFTKNDIYGKGSYINNDPYYEGVTTSNRSLFVSESEEDYGWKSWCLVDINNNLLIGYNIANPSTSTSDLNIDMAIHFSSSENRNYAIDTDPTFTISYINPSGIEWKNFPNQPVTSKSYVGNLPTLIPYSDSIQFNGWAIANKKGSNYTLTGTIVTENSLLYKNVILYPINFLREE